MNGTCPQEGLDAWLVSGDLSADIYCVCLQEVLSAGQWGEWRAAITKSLVNVGSYEDVKNNANKNDLINKAQANAHFILS